MALSKPHKKHLLTLCHALKPVVMIGQNGITENIINELEVALDFHELVKIKIGAGDRDDRQAIIDEICSQSKAEKVQAIGKTLTLFRRNTAKPKITF